MKRMFSSKGRVLDAGRDDQGFVESGSDRWGAGKVDGDNELRSVAIGETDASQQSTPVQHPSTPPRAGSSTSPSRAGGRAVGSLDAREWDERVAKKRGKDAVSKASSSIEVLQMAKYLGMVSP